MVKHCRSLASNGICLVGHMNLLCSRAEVGRVAGMYHSSNDETKNLLSLTYRRGIDAVHVIAAECSRGEGGQVYQIVYVEAYT